MIKSKPSLLNAISRSRLHGAVAMGLALASVQAGVTAEAYAAEQEARFDITAQPISSALIQFASQSKIRVAAAGVDVSAIETQGVSGVLLPEEALKQLLDGTGLSYSRMDNGSFVIKGQNLSAASSYDEGAGAETEEKTSFVLEEIIVTATKRAESLQDVPVAITAITPDDIRDQGLENYEDFARMLPGVSMDKALGRNSGYFTVRNINTNTVDPLGQLPVASYINDIPLSSTSYGTNSADIKLYDVERIEVLRGPQGTLFGSGSLSGAVRVITKKPVLDAFQADAAVDFGKTRHGGWRQRYNAMLNIPLVDNELAVRAVGYYYNEDGYVDNIGTGFEDSDKAKEWGGRLSARWQPNDRLTATFTAIHQDSKPEDSGQIDRTLGTLKRDTLFPEFASYKMSVLSGTVDYELDFATLTSISTYAETAGDYRADITDIIGGLFPWGWSAGRDGTFFTQEIRLVSNTDSAFEWVMGAFLRDEKQEGSGIYITDPTFFAARGITGAEDGIIGGRDEVDTALEKALFGEVSYHLTDQLTLTGGLRYASSTIGFRNPPGPDDKVGPIFGVLASGGTEIVAVPSLTDVDFEGTDSILTGKASLSWQPTDDQTYYLLASRGYRVAQINQSGFNNGGRSRVDSGDFIIPQLYSPDFLWNYEIGAKTQWMDRRVTLNVAAYYIPWSDIQLTARRLSDGAGFTANAAKAVSKGVEVELVALPTDRWEFTLNTSFGDAEITSVSPEETLVSGVSEGDPLPASVDFQISGSVQYSWPVMDGWEMYVRADAQHLDGSTNSFPLGPLGNANINYASNEGYENVNISLGLRGEQWRVVLYGENILNNQDTIRTLNATLKNQDAVLRPRTIGLRASWTY